MLGAEWRDETRHRNVPRQTLQPPTAHKHTVHTHRREHTHTPQTARSADSRVNARKPLPKDQPRASAKCATRSRQKGRASPFLPGIQWRSLSRLDAGNPAMWNFLLLFTTAELWGPRHATTHTRTDERGRTTVVSRSGVQTRRREMLSLRLWGSAAGHCIVSDVSSHGVAVQGEGRLSLLPLRVPWVHRSPLLRQRLEDGR